MGIICKDVYLDVDGKPSAAYYNNLHLGVESAKRIYLDSMKGYAFSNFQKVNAKIEDLLEESNQIKHNEDETKYIDSMGNILERSTQFLSQIQPNLDDEFFRKKAEEKAIRNKAITLIMNAEDVSVYGLTKKPKSVQKVRIDDDSIALKEAKKWASKKPEEFASKVKEISDLWAFKTEGGTDIHRIAEKYVNERNKLVPDEDGDIDIKEAKNKALEGESNKDEYTKLINAVEKFLKEFNAVGRFRFATEVKVADPALGIAGSIDLLAYDDLGNVYVFDYKTKEANTEYMFDMAFGKLKGPMFELDNSRENHGALQLSLYKLILERKGFNVIDNNILYIEADIEKMDGEYKYKNFVHKKNVILPNYRTQLIELFKEEGIPTKILDRPRSQEEGKLNTSSDIMEALHGQDLKALTDIDVRIANELDDPKKDPLKGKEYFINRVNGKKVYYTSDNKAKRKKMLKKHFEEEAKLTSDLANRFIKYFNGGKELNSWKGDKKTDNYTGTSSEQQAKELLAGLDRETHVLQQVKNFEGFNHVDPNILVAVNKIDQSAVFLHVSKDYDRNVTFDDDSRTTIFGNYLADNTVSRNLQDILDKRFHGIKGLPSNTKSYAIIELGLIASEMMEAGKINSVYNLKHGVIDNNSLQEPYVVGMNVVLPQIKLMGKLTEDMQSQYYKDLFNNNALMSAEAYKVNFLDRLMYQLETGFADLKHRPDLLEGIKENLKNREGGIINDVDLKSMLMQAADALTHVLSKSNRSIVSISEDADARILAETVLQLVEGDLAIGESAITNADQIIRASGRMVNPMIQNLDATVKKNKQEIASEYQRWKNKHDRLVKNLMKEKGVTGLSKTTSPDVFRQAFSNLYIIDPEAEYDKSTADMQYVLKPASTPGLKKAEIDYINFFNESIKKGFNYTIGNSALYKNAFTPEGDVDPLWQEGRIPMIHASYENIMQRTKGIKEKIALMKDKLSRRDKNIGEDFTELNTKIKNNYLGQIKNGFAGGKARRTFLGIDADGNIIGDKIETETNLETILNNFMMDQIMIAEYKETIGMYKAINLISTIEQNEHFNNTDKLRGYLSDYMKYIVFNQYENLKENNKLAVFTEKGHKLLSLAALGLSLKQFVLEMATNTYATLSGGMQQFMMKSFKAEHRFSAGQWAKAAAIASTNSMRGDKETLDAMTREWGLYKIDPESLVSKEMQESKKYHWFQSKTAFWLNNVPFRRVKQQMFVASIINITGDWKAMGTDKDGNLTYDATKDKRFKGIFDSKGNVKENLESTELKMARAKYEYLIKQLSSERGLDENGKPLRPIPMAEIVSIQDYAMGLFGSMSKDSKMLLSSTTLGQLLLKFKGWVPVKFQNYWTPTHESKIRTEEVWIEDPSNPNGGYYERVGMLNEGIIQTVVGLSKNIYDIFKTEGIKMSALKGEFGKLNQIQQENMTKLASDIIIISIMTSLLLAAMDYEREDQTETQKLLMDVLLNSTSDLNMFALTKGLTENSPIAFISYAFRTIDTIKKATMFIATGEPGKAAGVSGKMFGATKFPVAFYDDFAEDK